MDNVRETPDLDQIQQIAEGFAEVHGFKRETAGSFVHVMEFLFKYPECMSGRRIKGSPTPFSKQFFEVLADQFFKSREGSKKLTTKTIPDEMVSFIVQSYLECSDEKTAQIRDEHSLSMAAENLIGFLLEKYIADKLDAHGWVWCSGDFVKSVDFIRKMPNGTWLLLQVKNRDNSENSSSSSVRDGTEIKKWFRSFNKKTDLNWASFPDEEARQLLSEDGFKADVKTYIAALKTEES